MKYKKSLLIIELVVMMILASIGFSYAYYQKVTVKGIKEADFSTSSVGNVEVNINGPITFNNIFPGFKTSKKIVIDNEYNGDDYANVAIMIAPNLGVFNGDITWKLYKTYNKEIKCASNVIFGTSGTYDDATCDIPDDAKLVASGSNIGKFIEVESGYSTYQLVVEYANNGDQTSQMNKQFSIYVDVEKMTNLLTSGATYGDECPTQNDDGTVNIVMPNENPKKALLCQAPDNYGTSYYYRGNVQNNYVSFAGKTWRIVRINGDGTLRVIMNDTIGSSEFNRYWKKDNVTEPSNTLMTETNAGIGYMYGNRDGIVEANFLDSNPVSIKTSATYYVSKEYIYDEKNNLFSLKDPIAVLGSDISNDYINYYTMFSSSASESDDDISKIRKIESSKIYWSKVRYGTTSKEKTQENINDSTIKTYLDNWYESNIHGNVYEQFIADNIFCNDREFSGTLHKTDDPGYGLNYTYYRFEKYSWKGYDSNYPETNQVYLSCHQKNDAFTVNDTVKGNGALTYPIGLPTADEIALSGYSGFHSNASDNYLYDSKFEHSGSFWTMTPYSSGYIMEADLWDDEVTDSEFVRPVINISPIVLLEGDGTPYNPYRFYNFYN